MMTFEELERLEPELGLLMAEAKRHRRGKGKVFCANAVWYGYPGTEFEGRGLKSRVVRLVGNHVKPRPILSTSEAYDVASQAIYKALPDCRGDCRCVVVLRALA